MSVHGNDALGLSRILSALESCQEAFAKPGDALTAYRKYVELSDLWAMKPSGIPLPFGGKSYLHRVDLYAAASLPCARYATALKETQPLWEAIAHVCLEKKLSCDQKLLPKEGLRYVHKHVPSHLLRRKVWLRRLAIAWVEAVRQAPRNVIDTLAAVISAALTDWKSETPDSGSLAIDLSKSRKIEGADTAGAAARARVTPLPLPAKGTDVNAGNGVPSARSAAAASAPDAAVSPSAVVKGSTVPEDRSAPAGGAGATAGEPGRLHGESSGQTGTSSRPPDGMMTRRRAMQGRTTPRPQHGTDLTPRSATPRANTLPSHSGSQSPARCVRGQQGAPHRHAEAAMAPAEGTAGGAFGPVGPAAGHGDMAASGRPRDSARSALAASGLGRSSLARFMAGSATTAPAAAAIDWRQVFQGGQQGAGPGGAHEQRHQPEEESKQWLLATNIPYAPAGAPQSPGMRPHASADLIEGGSSPPIQCWAPEVAAFLRAARLRCTMADLGHFVARLIDRLIWSCTLWLVCHAHGGLTVGAVLNHYMRDVEVLARELFPIAHAYALATEPAYAARHRSSPISAQYVLVGLVTTAHSLARSVPSRELARTEFALRNGWFLSREATPEHGRLLEMAGCNDLRALALTGNL